MITGQTPIYAKPQLTRKLQDIYSIFGAAYGDRFEKIINGSQSKIKLNTLIQEEMSQ